MGTYINNKGKQCTVKLHSTKLHWIVVLADEDNLGDLEDDLCVVIESSVNLDKYFEDFNQSYLGDYGSYAKYCKLFYKYNEEDILMFNPIADYISYPAYESFGDDIQNYEFDREIILSKDEKEYFTGLLQNYIGDHHTPEEQRVMINYHNAVDTDIYNFINDVIAGREVLPITVGFVDESLNEEIKKLTGISVSGNRIILGADDVRHIIKRHGIDGKADHSMKNIEDIARLSYVLANYDSVDWDGGRSSHYRTKDGIKAPQIIIKKRIDGTYYVIEVVSDSRKKRNVVSSIRLLNN